MAGSVIADSVHVRRPVIELANAVADAGTRGLLGKIFDRFRGLGAALISSGVAGLVLDQPHTVAVEVLNPDAEHGHFGLAPSRARNLGAQSLGMPRPPRAKTVMMVLPGLGST